MSTTSAVFGLPNELFVIDDALRDIDTLVKSIETDKLFLVLDPAEAGGLQLAGQVRHEASLDAVHLLSHREDASLQLGSASLDVESLDQQVDALTTIGSALIESGELLLYGCDVAPWDMGKPLIAGLTTATRFDITALNDLTGTPAFGGAWTPEGSIGPIETNSVVGKEDMPADVASHNLAFNSNYTNDVIGNDTAGKSFAVTEGAGSSAGTGVSVTIELVRVADDVRTITAASASAAIGNAS